VAVGLADLMLAHVLADLMLARVLNRLALLARCDAATDVKILVPRYDVAVRRSNTQPRLTWLDRVLRCGNPAAATRPARRRRVAGRAAALGGVAGLR
jgi:hypothetical protein